MISRGASWWGGAARASLLALICVAMFVTEPDAAGAGETESFRFQPHPVAIQGDERRTFSYDLPAGTSITDAVQLTNKTDEVRRFRLYAADAKQDASGNVTVEEFDSPRNGVGSWIEIGQTDHSLLPRSSAVVAFAVERPPGEPSRGVGAIVAEEVTEPTDGGGIDVVFRIAILVRLGGDPTGVSLGEPDLSMPIELVPSAGSARVEVTNRTLEPVQGQVALTIESLTGRAWPLAPVDVHLEPGASTEVSQDWMTVPRWGGLFRVRATATWEGGTIARTGSRGTYPAVWLLALTIVAVGIRSVREYLDRRPGGGPPVEDADPEPSRVRELVRTR